MAEEDIAASAGEATADALRRRWSTLGVDGVVSFRLRPATTSRGAPRSGHGRAFSEVPPNLPSKMHIDPDQADSTMTGTIQWFDAETGLGSVQPDDGAPPCVLRSETLESCGIRSVCIGDRVQFRI